MKKKKIRSTDSVVVLTTTLVKKLLESVATQRRWMEPFYAVSGREKAAQ